MKKTELCCRYGGHNRECPIRYHRNLKFYICHVMSELSGISTRRTAAPSSATARVGVKDAGWGLWPSWIQPKLTLKVKQLPQIYVQTVNGDNATVRIGTRLGNIWNKCDEVCESLNATAQINSYKSYLSSEDTGMLHCTTVVQGWEFLLDPLLRLVFLWSA